MVLLIEHFYVSFNRFGATQKSLTLSLNQLKFMWHIDNITIVWTLLHQLKMPEIIPPHRNQHKIQHV